MLAKASLPFEIAGFRLRQIIFPT